MEFGFETGLALIREEGRTQRTSRRWGKDEWEKRKFKRRYLIKNRARKTGREELLKVNINYRWLAVRSQWEAVLGNCMKTLTGIVNLNLWQVFNENCTENTTNISKNILSRQSEFMWLCYRPLFFEVRDCSSIAWLCDSMHCSEKQRSIMLLMFQLSFIHTKWWNEGFDPRGCSLLIVSHSRCLVALHNERLVLSQICVSALQEFNR
jgi:hypothetical protein